MSALRPETDRTGDSLRRIADVLKVPVGVFHDMADRQRDVGTDPSSVETQRAELIALYDALRDPHLRQLCLDCVRCLCAMEETSTK